MSTFSTISNRFFSILHIRLFNDHENRVYVYKEAILNLKYKHITLFHIKANQNKKFSILIVSKAKYEYIVL